MFLFSSCSTGSGNGSVQNPYAWADSLSEKVQPIESSSSVEEAPMATPTDLADREKKWVHGTPRKLINTVSNPRSHTADGSGSRHHAKHQKQSASTHREGSQIIVNVNGNSLEQSPDSNVSEVDRSRLEGLYLGDYDRKANRELTQFGYSFFENPSASHVRSGSVPLDYLVGVGDEITLSANGAFEAYYSLVVDRNGQITIPTFGIISVIGDRFGDLKSKLFSFMSERRTGFELSVSMGTLRKIQVNVVGRVRSPGTVEVSALSNPLKAIIAAGGVMKDGSMRNIILYRKEKVSVQVDLYDYLLGQPSQQELMMLQEGDSLYVDVIGTTVGIAGYVQRPGIFELVGSDISVEEAIQLAGGLTPFSFTPNARLERTLEGRGRETIDLALNPEGMTTRMKSGELLLIEAVDVNRQSMVKIEGEVTRPGDYQYKSGMRLSDLIKRADGLTIDAYLPQVFVSRQIGDSEIVGNLTKPSSHRQSRRVVVSNLSLALEGDLEHDILLMPLDYVTVQSLDEAQPRSLVEVIGAVQRPGEYELTAGMKVSDLIAISGNPTAEAYYDEAELIRKIFDNKTKQLDVQRFRFNLREALAGNQGRSGGTDPILNSGDRLIVRSLKNAHVRVHIHGQVRFPGEYVFPAGARITELLAAAGGLLGDADMRAASFTRQSTREVQMNGLKHLTERSRRLNEGSFERMVQTGGNREGLAARISLQQTHETLERMQRIEASGRIVLPFEEPNFPESPYNLVLQDKDQLTIPRYEATVSVAGHVFHPLSLVAYEPVSVENALEQAGGLTEFGDKDLVYVIRADGRVQSLAQKSQKLNKNTLLIAGDVLLVPRKPMERTMGAQLTDTVNLLRQMTEVAVIGSQIGKDVDLTLVRPDYQNTGSLDAKGLLEDID